MPRRLLPLFCTLSSSLLAFLVAAVPAAGGECSGHSRTFDLARVQEQEIVLRGSVELVFENLNRLRHEIEVGQELALAEADDLSVVPFFPALAQAEVPEEESLSKGELLSIEDLEEAEADVQARDPADRSKALRNLARHIDAKVRSVEAEVRDLAQEAAKETRRANEAREALLVCTRQFEALVAASDTLLRNGGASALAAEVQEVLRCITQSQSRLDWPDGARVASLDSGLKAQKKELEELPLIVGFAQWHSTTSHSRRYDEVSRRIEALRSALAPLGAGGDATAAFKKGVAALGERQRLLRSLMDSSDRTAPYRLRHCVPCGFPRFRTQE